MRIYLLRHGETEWNLRGRLQGRGDSPLTPLGVAQAEACAEILAKELADPPAASLITSPLGRARQTGAILRARLPFAPERCGESELLVEHDMGAWEGLTPDEIDARFPGERTRRDADKWSYVVPQGESYSLVQARAQRWLGAQRRGEVLVVVAHSILSRGLRGAFLRLAAAATLELPGHRHGQIYLLEGAGCTLLQAEVAAVP
jgi:probable phosphoglycerate mutase